MPKPFEKIGWIWGHRPTMDNGWDRGAEVWLNNYRGWNERTIAINERNIKTYFAAKASMQKTKVYFDDLKKQKEKIDREVVKALSGEDEGLLFQKLELKNLFYKIPDALEKSEPVPYYGLPWPDNWDDSKGWTDFEIAYRPHMNELFNNVKEQNTVYDKEIAEYKDMVNKFQALTIEFNKSVDSLRKNRSTHRQNVEKRIDALAKMVYDIKAQGIDNRIRLESRIDEIHSEYGALNSRWGEDQKTIVDLNAELAGKAQQYKDLEQSLDEHAQGYDQRLAEYNEKLLNISKVSEANTEALRLNKSSFEQVNDRLNNLTKLLNNSVGGLNKFQNQNAGMELRTKRLEIDFKKNVKNLTEGQNTLRGDVDAIRQRMDEMRQPKNNFEETSKRFEEISESMSELNDKIDENVSGQDKLYLKLQDMRADLNRTQQQDIQRGRQMEEINERIRRVETDEAANDLKYGILNNYFKKKNKKDRVVEDILEPEEEEIRPIPKVERERQARIFQNLVNYKKEQEEKKADKQRKRQIKRQVEKEALNESLAENAVNANTAKKLALDNSFAINALNQSQFELKNLTAEHETAIKNFLDRQKTNELNQSARDAGFNNSIDEINRKLGFEGLELNALKIGLANTNTLVDKLKKDLTGRPKTVFEYTQHLNSEVAKRNQPESMSIFFTKKRRVVDRAAQMGLGLHRGRNAIFEGYY